MIKSIVFSSEIKNVRIRKFYIKRYPVLCNSLFKYKLHTFFYFSIFYLFFLNGLDHYGHLLSTR